MNADFDDFSAIPGARPAEAPGAALSAALMTLKPYVRQSGDSRRKAWFIKNRRLLDYLAVFIASGEGVFSVDGPPFPVAPGDLIWIPPGTPHEMRGTSPTMRCLYVHFDLVYDAARSHWDACVPGGTLDLSGCRSRVHPPLTDPEIGRWRGKLKVGDPAKILELMEKICRTRREAPAETVLAVSGMSLELVAAIYRDQTLAGPTDYRSRKLAEIAARVHKEAAGRMPAKDLARQAGLSESHFRTLFRKRYGKSPREAWRDAKLGEACELLAYSDLNISEIAERLGYGSIHHFSRAFRRETSLAPSAWRRQGEKLERSDAK